MTIGAFLMVAAVLFVIVELWPLAPTQRSDGPGQEETESHWHVDEGSEARWHAGA